MILTPALADEAAVPRWTTRADYVPSLSFAVNTPEGRAARAAVGRIAAAAVVRVGEVIADAANADGRRSALGLNTIAKRAGLSLAKTRRALAVCAALGFQTPVEVGRYLFAAERAVAAAQGARRQIAAGSTRSLSIPRRFLRRAPRHRPPRRPTRRRSHARTYPVGVLGTAPRTPGISTQPVPGVDKSRLRAAWIAARRPDLLGDRLDDSPADPWMRPGRHIGALVAILDGADIPEMFGPAEILEAAYAVGPVRSRLDQRDRLAVFAWQIRQAFGREGEPVLIDPTLAADDLPDPDACRHKFLAGWCVHCATRDPRVTS